MPGRGHDPHDDTGAEPRDDPARSRRGTSRERVLLHMPVDVRSLSLAVLAVWPAIFALQWAKAILVPILLGVMFSYALTPAIERLQPLARAARARRRASARARSSPSSAGAPGRFPTMRRH